MTQSPPRRPQDRNATSSMLERARLGLATTGGDAEQMATIAPAAQDVAAMAAQLMAEFESIVGQNSGLDPETRESIRAQFGQALEGASAKATAAVAIPDSREWADTVQLLQENGGIGDSEANELIRRFEDSMQPLRRRRSRIALEFASRLQTEGQESALAWYRAQKDQGDDGDATQGTAMADADVHPLRNEIVNSRSRRLRGPPFGS